MPNFSYKARKRNGDVVQGSLDVSDRANALLQIERMGLFPVFVKQGKGAPATKRKKKEKSGETQSTSALPSSVRTRRRRQRKPRMKELATFTQQLANLLNSGMPLTVALNSMTHLESKGISPEVSRQLKQEVMEGRGLSEAMAKQRIVFSDLYINMVRAGEQSGALVEVLRRLATHYERFADVRSKFVSAMIYPAVVICIGTIIVFTFMTFMLPKFLTIFEGMEVQLPTSTQMLINISHFFSSYWWVLLLTLFALVILFKRYQATEAGARAIDEIKMKAPVLGKVVKLSLFGQFSRTLATLLVNGVPVLTALKITEQVIPNRVVKEAIAKTHDDVTDGKTIAEPLARSKLFPQLMIDLVKIGEETGDVPGALENVAETYENELTVALRVMTNLIEPALIIVMAIMVAGLMFSVLSAMMAITSSVTAR